MIALSKGTIFEKTAIFSKNGNISNIKSYLLLKGIFSQNKYVCLQVTTFTFLA